MRKHWQSRAIQGLMALACVGLSACGFPTTQPPVNAPAVKPQVSAPSGPLNQGLQRYYANYELHQRARGLLRTDQSPSDTPYSPADLAQNFIDVALFEEYTRTRNGVIKHTNQTPLRRWADPIKITPIFGGSVPQADRDQLLATTAHLTNKLSQASGHPMAISADGNLHVLVLSEDERLAAAPLLRSLAPSVRADDINLIRHLGRSTQCVVMAFQDPDQKFTYNQAIVVIRAELSMHLKRTCLHEEITQGMGLSNDSPTARPSVFNDDDEFSFVTDHDMALLKLLYHPNLRPGMSHAQARPIVNMVLGLSTPQDQGM